jgi:hypothetical protein
MDLPEQFVSCSKANVFEDSIVGLDPQKRNRAMKKQISWFTGIALIVFTGTSAFSSLAQQREEPNRVLIERERVIQGPDGPPPPPDRMIFEREIMPRGHGGPHGPGDFLFLATEMSFGGQLIKGAPYSAQAVTESVQTLSDGNRIANKTTAAIYRDSEGRTRREQTFKAIGPVGSSGEPSQTIFISDPVAGTSYTLDPSTQVARKMQPMRLKIREPKDLIGGQKNVTKYRIAGEQLKAGLEDAQTHYRIAIESDKMLQKKQIETGVAMGLLDTHNPSARKESLGKQNIGGVEAEGTRTTVTIQAGEIGNERPIEIVSERWYSPELQVIVMTRHSDPRFGENTYQLTNINRTEPARELFEVPAGYTVKEAPALPVPPPLPMRVRKPEKNQE